MLCYCKYYNCVQLKVILLLFMTDINVRMCYLLLQACRGSNLDKGKEVTVIEDRTVADSIGDPSEYTKAPPTIPTNIRVPNDIDFLVLYSSLEGNLLLKYII